MEIKTKKAATVSSLTALGLASTAQGAIRVGNSFDETLSADTIGHSLSETFYWDVDGDSNSDATFDLDLFQVLSGSSLGFGSAYVVQREGGGLSFLASDGDLPDVAGSFVKTVGSSFFTTFVSRTTAGSRTSESVENGSTVGFKFQRGGETHYGVAVMSVFFGETMGESVRLSLTDVRWNDVADGDIAGNSVAVPEPASVGTGIGLLALGAAGLRSFRRKSRAA